MPKTKPSTIKQAGWREELLGLLIMALADFATEKEIRKPIRKGGKVIFSDLSDITKKHQKKFEALFSHELERKRVEGYSKGHNTGYLAGLEQVKKAPEQLLKQREKRAREEMGKALRKEDIGFLFLEKMKETNGVMLRSVIEAYHQAIDNYLKQKDK